MKFRTAFAGIAAAGTLATGLAVAAPAPPAAAYTCGYQRWPVKTGADADRYQVSPTVRYKSVGYLGSLSRPSSFGSYAQDHRIKWPELHIWQVRATLVAVKLESEDSDYHLRLRANGHNMIAEIPRPGCVSSKSLWRNRIGAARNWINARFNVSSDGWTYVYRTVKVRGLGFFDEEHNVTGAAPNYFELHPVTRISYP
jgi:hypothetical protein